MFEMIQETFQKISYIVFRSFHFLTILEEEENKKAEAERLKRKIYFSKKRCRKINKRRDRKIYHYGF